MDNREPTIEEKLVPFVEGALAEADRREVMQALPRDPALNQEARLLRETILLLRTQAAQGLTYQASAEVPLEQVVDFAHQGDQWSRQASRQFQLQMLESTDLAEEVSILRELEQELQQKVDSAGVIPPMSGALKNAIQECYAPPPREPGWKRPLALTLAWFAGLNLKVAGAAVAGVTVVVLGVGVGRYAHQQMQTSPTATGGLAVATPTQSPVASPAIRETVKAAAAPKGQVALLDEKVHPEDLPRLSRLLWQKQVSHSYRDGQIFVAEADVERAWGALSMNEKVASAKPLQTGPVPEDKPLASLDGIIGALPEDRASNRPQSQPKPLEKGEASTQAPPVPQVAIHLPAEPEVSRSVEQPVYRAAESRPAVAAAARNSVEPERRPAPQPVAAPQRVTAPQGVAAPPATEQRAQPNQMARLPEPQQPVAPAVAPVSQAAGASRSSGESARRRVASEPDRVVSGNLPPAPATKEVGLPAVASTGASAKDSEAIGAPRPQEIQALKPRSETHQANADTRNFKVESDEGPLPSSVDISASKKKSDEGVKMVPAGRVGTTAESASGPVPAGMKPVPRLREGSRGPNQVASEPESKLSVASSAQAQEEGFSVPADAPFEVAMLPIAKKLVVDSVGEARVQMERQDSGFLLITIRPTRRLSDQEIEKLRKLLREKLELKDEDSIVVRQP